MNNTRVPILLSPKQLLWIKNQPGILLVDTRPFPDYQKEHLPQAVNLPLLYYHWTDTSTEGIKAFNHHMQRVLALTGVSNRKHVIFYEDNSGMSASRGVWLLHYYGHNKTSLLDGGLHAWKKAGYKTSTETVPTRPARFRVKLHPEVLANISQVNKSLNDKNTTLLDVRSPEEYNGTLARAARRGHVPNARNVNWERSITRQGTFKPLAKLEQLYKHADVRRDQEIITYCQGGYRAAQTYIALKLLGYPRVRNYLGSWFEWGNTLNAPVEK